MSSSLLSGIISSKKKIFTWLKLLTNSVKESGHMTILQHFKSSSICLCKINSKKTNTECKMFGNNLQTTSINIIRIHFTSFAIDVDKPHFPWRVFYQTRFYASIFNINWRQLRWRFINSDSIWAHHFWWFQGFVVCNHTSEVTARNWSCPLYTVTWYSFINFLKENIAICLISSDLYEKKGCSSKYIV